MLLSPWVYTTYRCNLACPYCYVKQGRDVITPATLGAIEEIFPLLINRGKIEGVNFRLSGGEPLLVFEKWKEVFSRLTQGNKTISVEILTNLTVLEDEMVDWIIDHNCSMSVSLDGLTVSQPFHGGKNSAATVRDNLNKLRDHFRGPLQINTVLTEHSMGDIDHLAQEILRWGANWNVTADLFYGSKISYEQAALVMFRAIKVLKGGGYDLINRFRFNNMDMDLSRPATGCEAGNRLFAIGTAGEIWACQGLQGKTPACELDEFFLENLKNSSQYRCGTRAVLPHECKDCILRTKCAGGCKVTNLKPNVNRTCDLLKQVLLACNL